MLKTHRSTARPLLYEKPSKVTKRQACWFRVVQWHLIMQCGYIFIYFFIFSLVFRKELYSCCWQEHQCGMKWKTSVFQQSFHSFSWECTMALHKQSHIPHYTAMAIMFNCFSHVSTMNAMLYKQTQWYEIGWGHRDTEIHLLFLWFESSSHWAWCLHHPSALRGITVLTHAMLNQLRRIWASLSQTDTAVHLWHLNLIVWQVVKILHCLLSCC